MGGDSYYYTAGGLRKALKRYWRLPKERSSYIVYGGKKSRRGKNPQTIGEEVFETRYDLDKGIRELEPTDRFIVVLTEICNLSPSLCAYWLKQSQEEKSTTGMRNKALRHMKEKLNEEGNDAK